MPKRRQSTMLVQPSRLRVDQPQKHQAIQQQHESPAAEAGLKFVKPNLPILKGASSARQSFAYGAEWDDLSPPSRVMGPMSSRLNSKQAQLGGIIGSGLARADPEAPFDAPERRQTRTKTARSIQSGDDEEDELASEAASPVKNARPNAFRRIQGRVSAPETNKDLSSVYPADFLEYQSRINAFAINDGSEKSFGAESDVFDDATIASTPGNAALIQDIGSIARFAANNGHFGSSLFNTTNTGSLNDWTNGRLPNRVEEDEEQVPRPSIRQPIRSTQQKVAKAANTPAPKRPATSETTAASLESQPDSPRDHRESDIRPSTAGPSKRQRAEQEIRRSSSRGNDAREQQSDGGPRLSRTKNALQSSASKVAKKAISLAKIANPFDQPYPYASDHSERDNLIQQEITRAEEAASREREQQRFAHEKNIRRERQRRVAEERSEWWRQWRAQLIAKIWAFDPTHVFRAEFDLEASVTDSFLSLLNPLTYVRGLARLLQTTTDRFLLFMEYAFADTLFDGEFSFFGTVKFVLLSLVFLLCTMAASTFIMANVPSSGSVFPSWPYEGISWDLEFGDMTDNWRLSMPSVPRVGMPAIPSWPSWLSIPNLPALSIPSISWGAGSRWQDLPELWDLGEDEHSQVDNYVKRFEKEFQSLKNSGKLHHDAIKKLQSILPKVIAVELKNGKPVVSDEFWHALRALIHEDDDIFTFNTAGDHYDVSSDRQWKAVAAKLVKDPTFTSKLNFTIDAVEQRVNHRIANSWEAWIKNNDDKIEKKLGSAIDKIQSAGSQREFDERLKAIVKEQLSHVKRDSTLVTKDEFLRHIGNEMASHRTELKAELTGLQSRIQALVRQSVELATKDVPQSMSKEDISTLVKGLVRKSIADMNLQAAANGKIHAHWDTELKNRVNYFSVGSGAIIDGEHSSPVFKPNANGPLSETAYTKGLRGINPLPAMAAIWDWKEEGECFCAARSLNKRGNPHGAIVGVIMSYQIIPEHIVIEHILPGATIDPGARPKDIEIYASIEEHDVRERVHDFAATHFPTDTDSWNYEPAEFDSRFAKIGQFRYEGAELHDGVYVHRLSPELKSLNAKTDQILVRAVSNYGAQNHTCFYRVRLYGHNDALPGPGDED